MDFFDAPLNPMRAMNNEWDESAGRMPVLRFVGAAWDATLVLLFGVGVYAVITDGYGLGLGAGVQGLVFTLGGFVVWALLLALFFRPVGRAAILRVVALLRFIYKILRSLFGGPIEPNE